MSHRCVENIRTVGVAACRGATIQKPAAPNLTKGKISRTHQRECPPVENRDRWGSLSRDGEKSEVALPQRLKPDLFCSAGSARLEVVPFPVSLSTRDSRLGTYLPALATFTPRELAA
jgi:hypothetical protein